MDRLSRGACSLSTYVCFNDAHNTWRAQVILYGYEKDPRKKLFKNFSTISRSFDKTSWLELWLDRRLVYVYYYFLFAKLRLVEELEHTMDQDITEQKEQQKVRGGGAEEVVIHQQ